MQKERIQAAIERARKKHTEDRVAAAVAKNLDISIRDVRAVMVADAGVTNQPAGGTSPADSSDPEKTQIDHDRIIALRAAGTAWREVVQLISYPGTCNSLRTIHSQWLRRNLHNGATARNTARAAAQAGAAPVVGRLQVPDENYTKGTMQTVILVENKPKSIPDHVKEYDIDLDYWEIDRVKTSNWQGMAIIRRERATDEETGATVEDNTPGVVDLYQIQIWWKRRSTEQRGILELTERLKDLKLPPRRKSLRKFKDGHRRALEIDIMDPHFGLQCCPPVADDHWDLDIAEEALFMAIDHLLDRAEPYGPFERVVIPFGNDFVHTDNVFHTTTAGTGQPEAVDYHHVYARAKEVAIRWVMRLLEVCDRVDVLQIPGNHSRVSDFSLGHVLDAYFHSDERVQVQCDSSPYKFWRYGVNLIGFEHGHSVAMNRLAALMANERPQDWAETNFREWHLGDQHRKGSSKPITHEEQGVSVEYLTGLTGGNAWHRLKGFNHQKRGATAFVWDHDLGQEARLMFNLDSLLQQQSV